MGLGDFSLFRLVGMGRFRRLGSFWGTGLFAKFLLDILQISRSARWVGSAARMVGLAGSGLVGWMGTMGSTSRIVTITFLHQISGSACWVGPLSPGAARWMGPFSPGTAGWMGPFSPRAAGWMRAPS